ncbi:hypothetical protein RHOFW510R12_02225 [Rhodanobacter sp. FW510-R12]|uniref:DUF1329 domain-containing protein n=1 Tax=Rhodanobacter TaxID=75309 RepID=UPI00041E29D4|nr:MULTISPECIES: DUF1329 domain-containing protein [Rhodanobacter]TAN16490.1 MAG: DUF1329 domain-containing protein [Rhodanobacter sp.]UJJ54513.1 DUF1329 domain-containing protein [Rhodanobacter thiooxydans]
MKIIVSAVILLIAGIAGTAIAANLKPGDTIQASNLDARQTDTFEGHKVSDLLTDRMQTLIRNEGLVITLAASKPVVLGKDYMAATKANAGKAKYNPDTRLVEGWVAGMPFPDVTADDPHAADKLIWNGYYAQPIKNIQDYPRYAYLLISEKSGLERRQVWRFLRYYMKGRLGTDTVVEGDGSILSKTLMYATYPNDIRGLGLFVQRYDSPKLEDSWAYLKSVRRTRRLSGGTWMDPIGGSDQLNDDIEIFNAHPTWYASYRLLGKRWILATPHSTAVTWDSKASGNAEFPVVDLADAPHWNPKDSWEPREVWVIEAITPPGHPYSKKVLYMDTQFPRFYMAEAYDRKGDFWKWMYYGLKTIPTGDGDVGMISATGFTIDYQRRHATIFILGDDARLNTQGIHADDVNLQQLEKVAR